MNHRTIQIFDTTLRDGTQGEKISFSSEDKLRIAARLDAFGIKYIEGGWPGSNPRDMNFFNAAKGKSYTQARIVAFGSTCRADNKPADDPNIRALIEAETPAVSVFGKSWLLHVNEALGISRQKNLEIISGSVAYLKEQGKEVIYDAEHFFDGYRDQPEYALATLRAAEDAGADVLVLCDTNGGTLTREISRIVREVECEMRTKLGIHAHNDCELAVANTLAAVEAGCEHVQGTINGYGERCGNANLCSVIPNLQLKQGYRCIPDPSVQNLTRLSGFVSEIANVSQNIRLPYVGRSAFAHKGGIHVNAVMKNKHTYEHVAPEKVGNCRRVLVSDLSGKSNIRYKTDKLDIDLNGNSEKAAEIVQRLKELENRGFQFEAAEASFELLVRKMTGQWEKLFELEGYRVIIEKDASGPGRAEATIRINVNGRTEHSAAEGSGPVNALDRALRKALQQFYPQVSDMQLRDYKVRVLNEKEGTRSNVRVLIDSGNSHNGTNWGTVGVSRNIIDASWQALSDSLAYFLQQQYRPTQKKDENYANRPA